jgi:trigger factor
MTDETRTDQPAPTPGEEETRPEAEASATQEGQEETTATATEAEEKAAPGEEAAAEEAPKKLHQEVEISDVGPCKKHVKVTVGRDDIEGRIREHFNKLRTESAVPGFRPGKVPRKIIERRFQKEVDEQVKTEVLFASLEQLGEEQQLTPLSQPKLDLEAIDIPKEGPFVYEFEVEVAPEFELPQYKGLQIRRPVHTFTDAEIDEQERRLLRPYGQVVPKEEGSAAEPGDVVIADVTTRDGDRVLSNVKEAQVLVERQLAFRDALAPKFAEQMVGVRPGETRTVEIEVSSAAGDPGLRGKTVQATFEVKDLKTYRLPELTHEFCHHFGVHSADQLRELIRVSLERRLEHEARQLARQQVVEQISAASSWELPQDLLARQARSAMARRIMEMRADGISEEEIAARRRVLEQDILQSTAFALKEHFVLQKIAQVEKIEVSEDDIDNEIERLAHQNDESPRRVRARLEKEDMLGVLEVEMIERKALDLVLDNAQYENVPLQPEDQAALSTVEAQATPGEMYDPSAVPEESAEQEGRSDEAEPVPGA